MLNKRSTDFAEHVWEAASRFGSSATKIADDIMKRAFPQTYQEARIEGADRMLRTGIIKEVKRILTKSRQDTATIDFSTIEASYGEIVHRLKKRKYFVPSAEEYVDVADLIAEPDLLKEAGEYMSLKGHECLAEAKVIRELHDKVTR